MGTSVLTGEKIYQNFMGGFVNPLLQIGYVLTFTYFLYGVAYYLWQMNKEEAREKARLHLLWGTIGLFIMFSINGILKVLNSSVGGFFGY